MNDFPSIVGVGHNCIDYLCTVECYPPEDGSTHITAIDVQGGGAAATAMVAASRLGYSSALAGKLADDSAGIKIMRFLQDDGVNTDYISLESGGRSSVSYVMVNPQNGTRTKFPYPDNLSAIEWNQRLKDLICKAKIVHLDGTRYENALAAAEIAKKAGVSVSLDGCSMQADNEKNKILAGMTDILIMNAKYPTRVSGIKDYKAALLEIAQWGPKIVIGTQGGEGCFAVIDGKVVHFPAYRVPVVDTTGAGDVFHGAFLVGFLEGMDLHTNIRFASAVAALKCTKIGGRSGIPGYEKGYSFMNEGKQY
ncbi:carbohydrate kinase family protein [Treponema sp. OMZ 840]|uniref:carbohydrate kinase family protein n=1 Tax=Treponema sp. OMZ 840 TaxID=244313 RepID=UPI003D8BB178